MFMPREMIHFQQKDSEMLEMNMTSITNELSELIVGAAKEPIPVVYGDCAQSVENNVGSGIHKATMNAANFDMNYGSRLIVPIQEHAYFSNVDQLRYSHVSFCRNKFENNLQPLLMEATNTSNMIRRRSHSVDASTFEYNQIPKEFKTGTCYKRRASAAEIDSYEALICSTLFTCTQTKHRNNGSRRKFSRMETNEPIDYDSVVIDLKAIGLSTENKETNDVLRLFAGFRKLHYYLNDIVPLSSNNEPDLNDYPTQFVKPSNPVPCTMNVQSQIKHAMHKSNAYFYRQFEKLDEFKMVDRQKYIECSRSLFFLRKMIKQLEPFKKAEFEHKQGVFINSFGAAQAKNLDILLLQIIGKIRECNIYVEVYLWSVRKNIQTNNLPNLEMLKKAVAIVGATLKESPTKSLKAKDEIQTIEEQKTVEEISEENHFNGNEDGNGGGFGRVAVLPVPFFDARAMRYIGF